MPTTKTVTAEKALAHPDGGRLTWEVARWFPAQGHWTERDYLNLESVCGHSIRAELSRGRLEVLPVPTQTHQLIILFMVYILDAFSQAHAPGVVLFSGIRVRLKGRKQNGFREPDVVYMKAEHAARQHDAYWEGADLVMEVVSGDPEDRERDLVVKPKENAAAGIPEYWIIDPEQQVVRVLTLAGKTYRLHGDFRAGDQAGSVLLPGFTVAVADVWAAATPKYR